MEEETLVLSGYVGATRRYFFRGAIICAGLSVIFLVTACYWAAMISVIGTIPLLIVVASLMAELWWRSKLPLNFVVNTLSLKYGDEPIPWEDINRYTKWGPIGIPWTPIKFEGVLLYLKTGKTLSVYSYAAGYPLLMQRLQTRQFPAPIEPVWYCYPPRVLRSVRYLLAFLFSILYMLVWVLWHIIILVAAVAGYFVVRSFIKSYRKEGKALREDIWIALFGCVLLVGILVWLLNWPFVRFLVGFIPVALLLWIPWQPEPFAIYKEALCCGKKMAYPLRYLKVNQTISKFFIFKMWQLKFANGDVFLLPVLEDFDNFKKKFETTLDEVQKHYQGQPIVEAEIRAPEEEVKKIQF